jgi:outer membrane protein assembly factor BamB
MAPPGFSGARGYFPIEEGRVAAYDLAGARRLWVAAARAQSRPAAGDNLVFLAEPDAIVALHDEDGAPAWRVPIAERLAVPIVWEYGWLITASVSGTVSAYRATDGHHLWQYEAESHASAAPDLAADRVYVPLADGRVVALQVQTGEQLWARRLTGTPHDILALDDRLFVGSTDNYFYCLAADEGRVRWRWRTGGDVIGLPVVDDRRVYFVSLDNLLRGLDRNNGAQRWLSGLPLRPSSGPVKAADTLIVSGISPRLPAYALHNGAPAGEIEAPGDLASPPHVIEANGSTTIVIVTRDIAKGAEIRAFGRQADAPLP